MEEGWIRLPWLHHCGTTGCIKTLHWPLYGGKYVMESFSSSPFRPYMVIVFVATWVREPNFVRSAYMDGKWNSVSISCYTQTPSSWWEVRGQWPCSPGQQRSVAVGAWAVCSGPPGPRPATGWSERGDKNLLQLWHLYSEVIKRSLIATFTCMIYHVYVCMYVYGNYLSLLWLRQICE